MNRVNLTDDEFAALQIEGAENKAMCEREWQEMKDGERNGFSSMANLYVGAAIARRDSRMNDYE